MSYVKIIPCIDIHNPLATAKYYNDAGADEIAYFDSNAIKEGRDANIELIKEISRAIDIPIIACGGVRKLEDVKKILYAGAAKVCMKSAALENKNLVKEACDRFGSERIIVTIDLNEVKDPYSYAAELEKLGVGELLLLHNNKLPDYEKIADKIRIDVKIPIIVSTYATKGEDMVNLIKNTSARTVSLYNLEKMDIMAIKQSLKANGIPVNTFESTLEFKDFKLNSDGMIPVITQDYKTNDVLMMAYMDEEAFNKTIETGLMTYYSRSRNELWTKGLTSGHLQYVKSLTIDCDNDTILAKVSQIGAACHTGNRTCFFTDLVKKEYDDTNPLTVFNDVYNVIMDRKNNPKEGSYTNYLFDKGIDKILKKVGEEATEIVIAAKNPDSEELKYEISDFMYHVMVLMAERGLDWNDIIAELADRE